MRVALICYHKNLNSLYPLNWINQYRNSILNQTYQDFDIFELNYGGGQERIFTNSVFVSHRFQTFVHAMNYMLDSLFQPHGYDCVFNTNCDDYYAPQRIERQLPWIEQGFDIVSSNYTIIRNEIEHEKTEFHNLDIGHNLNSQHNIVAHPAVAYSKKFWNENRYDPNEIPYEDLKLWQRSFPHCRFKILAENLLFYRLHKNSVCQNPTSR